jgi:hypothetical protein
MKNPISMVGSDRTVHSQSLDPRLCPLCTPGREASRLRRWLFGGRLHRWTAAFLAWVEA